MSDIFISYSKADHALALKLSAFLEAEGWTVWWDKSLSAADLYRDEIMKQLAAARAVITIWSPSSVKSDWVRAEAGRAKAEGKLIPVKTADVAYADIPLPFGEMHTENVGSTDLVRAAIVAQLAKPAVTLSPFWQITGVFKYQALTWIGVVGSTITLFANLNGALVLADWAKELVGHWQDWIQMFWGWVFSFVKIKVSRDVATIISFTVFTVMLVIGLNRTVRANAKLARSSGAAPVITARAIVVVLGYITLSWLGGAVLLIAVGAAVIVSMPATEPWVLHLIMVTVYIAMIIAAPLGYLLYVSKDRPWVVAASVLFIVIGIVLLFIPIGHSGYSQEGSSVLVIVLFQICWIGAVLFSPLLRLIQRLGIVVLGVLTLLALSEISKLNLHQYLHPTKVSQNLVR